MPNNKQVDPESLKLWDDFRKTEPTLYDGDTKFRVKSRPEMMPKKISMTLGKIIDDLAKKKIDQPEKTCCRAVREIFPCGTLWASDGVLIFPMAVQYCPECGRKL